jgi:CubicO group peptidase (beta-lactamase class C family)
VFLDSFVRSFSTDARLHGGTMAIIQQGEIVWRRAFGVQDGASGMPADDDTIFEAASMSKPVFAYTVMKLVENGVLDLDRPLTEYVSERFVSGDARLDLITARQVLSHTSGFQDIRSGSNPLRIHFAPGEKWLYSGEGYAYLQSVMTALTGHVDQGECSTYEADLIVCGTDFDAYMKANLLEPFGMDLSTYVGEEDLSRRLARPHDDQGMPLTPRKYTAPDAARYGSMGGLLTTATEYAKFLIEIVDPKPDDPFRLTSASLEEMLRPQVKVEDGPGYGISWALGWKIAETEEFGKLVSHGGDQTGFHSLAEFSPKGKSGYVVLTNGDNGWKLIQELAPRLAKWVHLGSAG